MVPMVKCNLRRFQCMITLQDIGTFSFLILRTSHVLMLGNPKNLIIYHWRCANIVNILLPNLVFLVALLGFLCTRNSFFFPVVFQLCSLVSLQRYTKSLSSQQRASLVEKSRQKPLERKKVLADVNFSMTLIFLFLQLFFCCSFSVLKFLAVFF